MDLLDTTREAFRLLFSGDPTLWGIVWVSIKVSVLALMLAGPVAVAVGFVLAHVVFPGRRLLDPGAGVPVLSDGRRGSTALPSVVQARAARRVASALHSACDDPRPDGHCLSGPRCIHADCCSGRRSACP